MPPVLLLLVSVGEESAVVDSVSKGDGISYHKLENDLDVSHASPQGACFSGPCINTEFLLSPAAALGAGGAELGDSWSDGADTVTAPKIADKPPRER